MPVISKSRAIEQLLASIENFDTENLVDLHNELFPAEMLGAEGKLNRERLLLKTKQRIEYDLADEEIDELWNVVFPSNRDVWYDEVEGNLHYSEEPVEAESPE